MKILHIIRSVDPRDGGPIEGIKSSADIWLNDGHEVCVACLDYPAAPFLSELKFPVFALGAGGIFRFAFKLRLPFSKYGYSPRFTQWLRSNAGNYDAIILHGLWNYSSFGAWRVLGKGGISQQATPYFIFPHGMLDPWFQKKAPIKGFLKSLYWKACENKVLHDARGVFFTAEEEKRLAATAFIPYEARSMVSGYGAKDFTGDRLAQTEAFYRISGISKTRNLILFLGRIHPKKGLDLLIEAFARHADAYPDYDLAIVGPDQTGWKKTLVKLAENHRVAQRIHWPGMLIGDAKDGAFHAATFFALTSHQENFGIALAEALAAGLPVLTTNKVNIWREIDAACAGVVTEDTIECVSDGFGKMMALSRNEAESMRKAARQCFVDNFDMMIGARKFLQLVKENLHQDSPSNV